MPHCSHVINNTDGPPCPQTPYPVSIIHGLGGNLLTFFHSYFGSLKTYSLLGDGDRGEVATICSRHVLCPVPGKEFFFAPLCLPCHKPPISVEVLLIHPPTTGTRREAAVNSTMTLICWKKNYIGIFNLYSYMHMRKIHFT